MLGRYTVLLLRSQWLRLLSYIKIILEPLSYSWYCLLGNIYFTVRIFNFINTNPENNDYCGNTPLTFLTARIRPRSATNARSRVEQTRQEQADK